MKKQFLVIDAGGFVLAHFGANDRSFEGLHFASIPGLEPECKSAVEELLNESGATDRQEGRARRIVHCGGLETEICLAEVIRVERVGCDLRRAVGELLFPLSHQAKEVGVQLTVKMAGEIPERILVDKDKFIWATTSLIRNSLYSVRRGTILRPGGTVEVDLNYDSARNLISVTVEDDGRGRDEASLAEPTGGFLGTFTGAGKFVRAIVEAHGGLMIWERLPANSERVGNRVYFTIPAL